MHGKLQFAVEGEITCDMPECPIIAVLAQQLCQHTAFVMHQTVFVIQHTVFVGICDTAYGNCECVSLLILRFLPD